jgi:hypothetical protein
MESITITAPLTTNTTTKDRLRRGWLLGFAMMEGGKFVSICVHSWFFSGKHPCGSVFIRGSFQGLFDVAGRMLEFGIYLNIEVYKK